MAADRAWREEAVRKRPVIGRLASAVTPKVVAGPESQSTTAWKTGAEGEKQVAAVLARCAGVAVLHDRRVPGTKSNIDHLAVAASGIYVIDAKRYSGRIDSRNAGTLFRADWRLTVGGRDGMKLVVAMHRQVEVVAAALVGRGFAGTPLHGTLCFVGADWALLSRPIDIGGGRLCGRERSRSA